MHQSYYGIEKTSWYNALVSSIDIRFYLIISWPAITVSQYLLHYIPFSVLDSVLRVPSAASPFMWNDNMSQGLVFTVLMLCDKTSSCSSTWTVGHAGASQGRSTCVDKISALSRGRHCLLVPGMNGQLTNCFDGLFHSNGHSLRTLSSGAILSTLPLGRADSERELSNADRSRQWG